MNRRGFIFIFSPSFRKLRVRLWKNTEPPATRGGSVCRELGGLGGRLAVTDVVRSGRLDLRQGRPHGGADPNHDPIADDELRGVDHRRDLALPEKEDGASAEAERLV